MLKTHSRAAALAAALFVCALGAGHAGRAWAAAQLSVEPLLLTLSAGKLATSLTLGNNGGQPVTIQTELFSWNQDSGADAYGEAAGLVVSPPIFSLAGGARQVVRVGRIKRGTPPQKEQAYRIKLTEVPPQASDKLEAVATYMQLSLPIFVPPADKSAKPAVAVTAAAQPEGDLKLGLVNTGLVHDKITRLTLTQEGKPLAERALNYYVLAGARRELVWPGALKNAKAGPIELKVQLDGRNRILTQAIGTPSAAPSAPAAAPPAPPAPEAKPKD